MVLPLVVTILQEDVHSHSLPLGNNFQEGGTGDPMFLRPQDWPDAIHQNSPSRPQGVQHWGFYPVNLNDSHIRVQTGRMVCKSNRPPTNHHDLIDSQPLQKVIEVAFFQEAITILSQPHTSIENRVQLAPGQHSQSRQPFLTDILDLKRPLTKDVVQYSIRSGVTRSWIRWGTVIGFTRVRLRDWHQAGITNTVRMGQLFLGLDPNQPIGNSLRAPRRTIRRDGEVIAEVSMQGEDEDALPLEPVTRGIPSPLHRREGGLRRQRFVTVKTLDSQGED